jgi:hypothetical protein
MEHVDIRLPHSVKFSARITGSVNRIFFEKKINEKGIKNKKENIVIKEKNILCK